MGNRISSGSGPRSGTVVAKLIRVDGDLQVFNNPIKISSLLTTDSNTFICNSDQMDFNQFLKAMKCEEELLVGELYFELPVNWLTRRIQAADMGSLAVKATTALAIVNNDDDKVRCGGCYYYGGRKRVDPLGFLNRDYVKFRPERQASHMQNSIRKNDDIARGVINKKNKIFVIDLTVILEE